MRLYEFDMDTIGSYSASNDKLNQTHLNAITKPRLTLKHLNRLKKMRASEDLENLIRSDTLELMYSQEAMNGGGGDSGGFM